MGLVNKFPQQPDRNRAGALADLDERDRAEKGKANRAMLKAVGEWFGVPARLHSGASSPFKTVALSSTMEAVRARLEEK